MSTKIANLTMSMIEYEGRCVERVHHFLKVYAFAQAIGELEALDEHARFTLDAAALVHDIGIKVCLDKHASAEGHLQEVEGPPIAEGMLAGLDFPPDVIQRVSYLIAHHHTYTDVVGMDYQILVEADFLVNIHEGRMSGEKVTSVKRDIFRTKAGIAMLNAMYTFT